MEKANTSVRKEFAELKTNFDASERKSKKVEKELKETQAALKLEKEISEATNEAYKESVENLTKEKAELLEQLEMVAFESMMNERSNLMEEYLAGKNVGWKPEKLIREYGRLAAGLSVSSEGDEEERGEEVLSKEVVEEQVATGEAEEERVIVEKHVESVVDPESTEIGPISDVPSQTPEATSVDVMPTSEVPGSEMPAE